MAKKKSSSANTKIEAKWPEQMKAGIFFSQYLIVQQVRQYASNPDEKAVLSLISYLHVLRIMVENLPVWPRNFKFERSELAAWQMRIVENMTLAKSKVSVAYRDKFEKSVMDDLAFLLDYMNREKDPAKDI